MHSLTNSAPPVVVTRGSTDPDAPLVVLLHGRGSDEQAIIGLAGMLPQGAAYAAGGLLLADPQRFAGAPVLYGTMPFDAGLDTGPGALADVPVFVAQGDADGVIPLDLQQRTWTYVRGDSGAETTSYRDGGGHGLTQGAVDALRGWPAERIA